MGAHTIPPHTNQFGLFQIVSPQFVLKSNQIKSNRLKSNKTRKEVQKIITVKDARIINYVNNMCKERDYIKVKPIYIDFNKPKFNCMSYYSKINLDGNGDIGGCGRQIPPNSCFGNIFTDKDSFNSLEMNRLRGLIDKKHYAHKECAFCFGNWCN